MNLEERFRSAITNAEEKEYSVEEFTAVAIAFEQEINAETAHLLQQGQVNYHAILVGLLQNFLNNKPDGVKAELFDEKLPVEVTVVQN